MEATAHLKQDVRPRANARTAQAIDRVLEAERIAAAEIANCERRCAELVEQAHRRATAIADRARARIVALHARSARALEALAAGIADQHGQAETTAAEQPSEPAVHRAALESLAAQLSSAARGQSDDVT